MWQKGNLCKKWSFLLLRTRISKVSSYHAVDKKRYGMVLLPSLLAFLIFLNSLEGDFVHDDIAAIVRNPDVTGNRHWSQIFFNDFWGDPMSSNVSHKSFRPLTTFVFRWAFNVGSGTSTCFHIVNVVLHVLVTTLFRISLASLYKKESSQQRRIIDFASVIFAIHPIHTEAVSGIVGCADLLAGFFILLTFIIFIRFGGGSPNFIYVLCCIFAIFSKETGVMASTIVVGLFIYRIYDDDDDSRSNSISSCWNSTHKRGMSVKMAKHMLVLSALLYLRLCLVGQKSETILPHFSPQDNLASFHPHFSTRLRTFLYLPAQSFWLLLCPSTLSYDWQMGSVPMVQSWMDFRFLLTLAFYALIVTLVIRSAKEHHQYGSETKWFLRVAVLFLILPYLPASNLFFPVGFVIAERVLYISSIGYCILVSIGYFRLQSYLVVRKYKMGKVCGVLLKLALALVIVSMAIKTMLRNEDWRSRRTLFESGIKYHPSNAKVHYNYGNWLKDEGQLDAAALHYKEAIRLWPSYTLAHNNLATVVSNELEAEKHLRTALSFDPGHLNSLFNMAILLRRRGLCSQAIPLLERCVSGDESNKKARQMLIECLNNNHNKIEDTEIVPQEHNDEKSRRRNKEDFRDEDEILTSKLADSYINLGLYNQAKDILHNYLLEKQFEKYHQRKRLTTTPSTARTWLMYQLSQIFLLEGLPFQALKTIRSANSKCKCKLSQKGGGPRCTPLCKRAIAQEADILQELHRFQTAASKYSKALTFLPNDPQLLLSLGTMHHVMGKYQQALHFYTMSYQIQPNSQLLLDNMNLLLWSSKELRNSTNVFH